MSEPKRELITSKDEAELIAKVDKVLMGDYLINLEIFKQSIANLRDMMNELSKDTSNDYELLSALYQKLEQEVAKIQQKIQVNNNNPATKELLIKQFKLWSNIKFTIKEVLNLQYWTNFSNNKAYLRIDFEAYQMAVSFGYICDLFDFRYHIPLNSNHNDRSIRLTYEIAPAFTNGVVLMASKGHGVDAVVCFSNENGAIVDENNNVLLDVNQIDKYIKKCLSTKNTNGLMYSNVEYKTMGIANTLVSSFLKSVLWFSHEPAKKDLPDMDCFVYSLIAPISVGIRYNFVYILKKEDVTWFNSVLNAERKLYDILATTGYLFTEAEVPNMNKFMSNSFDQTDLHLWMLSACKCDFKNANNTWYFNKNLKDAVIDSICFANNLNTPESDLTQAIKQCFDDYGEFYENKIDMIKKYLYGCAVDGANAAISNRIPLFVEKANNALNELKEILIKKMPWLKPIKNNPLKP